MALGSVDQDTLYQVTEIIYEEISLPDVNGCAVDDCTTEFCPGAMRTMYVRLGES